MKLKKILMLGLLLAALPAAALAFPVQAYVEVTPFQARGHVMNYYSYPITCAVRVQGLRNDGFSVWAQNQAVLYPGISVWATAWTSPPFQFVNAWAFADCY